MGASMALAGLAGCTKQPDETIYPYIKQPEDLVLGKPMYFATAHPFTTGGVPLLVKSDEFRPIKIDGNPEHAYNRGSSDPYSQGTLLDLYDPDRSKHVTFRGESREWAEFAQALRLKAAATKDGTGIYILSAAITSPTLARQWKAVQAAYPKLKLVQYDPALAGTAASKGANAQYSLDQADVIVSLDADFLKVPHHGSRTSTTEPFLESVHPKFAAISVGESNPFGHPNDDVIDRIEMRGTKLYRTDRDGAITVLTDGNQLELHTFLAAH
jgi:molybdopterin-containing oxidoreductase family iron-sulfur binding subunit